MRIIIIGILAVFVASIISPTFVSADGLVPENCQRGSEQSCGIGYLKTLALNIINALLGFAGIISVAFFVWGGLRMMMSGGNPQIIQDGKSTMFNALFGLVIVGATWITLNLVVSALTGRSLRDLTDFWNLTS